MTFAVPLVQINSNNPQFQTILYHTSDHVAYITLNRPQHYNAIIHPMPAEIATAVQLANNDKNVRVIVVSGSGRGFCGGYDLQHYAAQGKRGEIDGSQNTAKGYDALLDYQSMSAATQCYMSLYHSQKPTIAKVHGAAVAGGSDIALCCDFIIMTETAKIGYMPARVWGCPTTAMWTYRIGMQQAKRMLLTGDIIDGREAERIGLVLSAVPADQLDHTVNKLIDRIKGITSDQLWLNKSVINQVYNNTLQNTQHLAIVYDGLTRHSPSGVEFQQNVAKHGMQQAIAMRDRPNQHQQSNL